MRRREPVADHVLASLPYREEKAHFKHLHIQIGSGITPESGLLSVNVY